MDAEQRAELEQRVVQHLADAQVLLRHWTTQVVTCENCKKLAEETAPFVAGLGVLLKELRAAK